MPTVCLIPVVLVGWCSWLVIAAPVVTPRSKQGIEPKGIQQAGGDSAAQAQAHSRIFALKEIKLADKTIRKASNNQRSIAFIEMKETDKSEPYFSIQAGDNRADRFETFYFFNYYPKTKRLEYLEVVHDTLLLVPPGATSLPKFEN